MSLARVYVRMEHLPTSLAAQMARNTNYVQTWEYLILAVAVVTVLLAIVFLVLRKKEIRRCSF